MGFKKLDAQPESGATNFRAYLIAPSVAAVSALALSLSLSAQDPVIGSAPICGGLGTVGLTLPVQPLEPRSQLRMNSVQAGTDLCATYVAGGWEETMLLYFGEGAEESRELIEATVEVWNEALRGFNRKPVIEIATEEPQNFYLPDGDLSSNNWKTVWDLANDGQSVIYFKGSGIDSGLGGFAQRRLDDTQSSTVEADVYINLAHAEEYGPYLIYTQTIFELDDYYVHAVVGSVYQTVLHELGHALGLHHVPVSGNVMSYNYRPYLKNRWSAPAVMEIFRQVDKAYTIDTVFTSGPLSTFTRKGNKMPEYTYMENPTTWEKAMFALFTTTSGLGEQDRSALLCAYDFSDWNH